ncbi:MAG: tetratricopeptide repeat protein [Thermoplasmata archaeon]|nr:tetratricopeptide repeat protein [Candidatus Sysuiplasma acidicola]MBX8647011.1 tetratricopeptide repeat protein [Candidatus Sysuiplasma acidicola]
MPCKLTIVRQIRVRDGMMRSDEKYYAAIESISVLERYTAKAGHSLPGHRMCGKLYSCLGATRGFVDETRLYDFARRLAQRSTNAGEAEYAVKFIRIIPEEHLTAGDREILVDALISLGRLEESGQMLNDEHWKDSPASYHRLLGKLRNAEGDEQGAKEAFRNAVRAEGDDSGAIEALLALSKTPSEEVEFLRLKADSLLHRGEAVEALKIYRKLMRFNRESPGILKSAGVAYADLKRPVKAEKLLLRSIEKRNDIETGIALGLVETQLGKYSEAYLHLSSAVEQGAGGFDLLAAFCRTCLMTGREERAVEVLESMKNQNGVEPDTALKTINGLTMLAGSRDCNNFTLHSTEIAEHYGKPASEIMEMRVGALMALSKYDEALSYLDGHFQKHDRFALTRMKSLRETGRMDEAEKIADSILSTNMNDDEALSTKMQAMFFRNMGKEAIGAYGHRVLNKGGRNAVSTLLEVAKAEGDDKLALGASQTLISMGVRERHILNDRATALEKLGRLKQSEKCYRQMYDADGSPEALELLSSFYARHGYIRKEEEVLSNAVESGLHVPYGLIYRLAKIRLESGDGEGSLKAIEKSLSNRETPEGRYLQSEVLLKIGRSDGAIEAAQKSMVLGYPAKLAEIKVAEALIMQSRKEDGLQHYNRAIGFGSTDERVYISKARLLQSMGRTEEAASEIQLIERMFGDSISAREECAAFYYSAEQYQNCIGMSESIIKKDRENFTAWKMRGLSMIALKNYDEGIKSLESCAAEKRDMEMLGALKTAYAARNDASSVVKTIDMMLGGKGASRELLLEKGHMLESSGRHVEALDTFQKAMEEFGKDEQSVTGKASVLHRQGRYAEELKMLLDFLKGKSDAPVVLGMVAAIYSEMKRYSDALEYADRAMQADPGSSANVDMRAKILMSMQRYNEAERSIDIALELNPKDPVALELKGNLLMIDGGHAQALEIFNGALAAGICNASIYKNRGDCLLKAGRYTEALDSYNKSSKLEQGRTDALLGRGVCEYNLERYSSATMSLNEFTKKEPDNAAGWFYFGLVLHKQRLASEAKKAFEEAVRLDGTHDKAWFELGKMHLEEGNLKASKEALSKSLELNPENSEAREKWDLCVAAERRVKAEDNARALMKLEYEIGRVPTREEAFSVCKIPMDGIDEAFEAIQEPTSLTVPMAGDAGWESLEERSAAVMQKCFRNDAGVSSGIRLCDIAVGFPSYTIDECKQILEYIRKVQQMGLLEGVEDARFEKLMKKATRLKGEDRTLVGIVTNLGVGIYTARLILGSLAAMGKTGYRTDYVSVSPPAVESTEQEYDPYEARRELMEQYYGGSGGSGESLPEPEDEKCLYHGREAMGECSACRTNVCDDCLSGTGGFCPNCGVILAGEESESSDAAL